jgi:linker histone H1 and H5 family
MTYRKLIIKAVEELRDLNMRSSKDAIYRYVESHIPVGMECNYPLFLTDLKALAEDGILEITPTHCSFSQSFKKKRIMEIQARALALQLASPNLNVWMDLMSDDPMPPMHSDHIKCKEAKRRVTST